MKYRILCLKGIIMIIVGTGFYWAIPRILSEAEGIIWFLIGFSGLVASGVLALYGGSIILALILFYLFSPDGRRSANKKLSRAQSTQPTESFDPWIKAPKVKKTEKKEKPLPKIWKDKVLTSAQEQD